MLKKVLSDLNKKECEEDPIPVKLLLQCIDEVKNILLFIINQSLFEGVFPSDIKTAVVRPAIKDQKWRPKLLQKTIDPLAICLSCPRYWRNVSRNNSVNTYKLMSYTLSTRADTGLTGAVRLLPWLSTMTFCVLVMPGVKLSC